MGNYFPFRGSSCRVLLISSNVQSPWSENELWFCCFPSPSFCLSLQVQYGAYAGVGGISNVIKLMFAGMMFWFLVKFSFGRNLLIKVNDAAFTTLCHLYCLHTGFQYFRSTPCLWFLSPLSSLSSSHLECSRRLDQVKSRWSIRTQHSYYSKEYIKYWVHFLCVRWKLPPSSLPFLERATPRAWTLHRENQMGRSAS